MELVILIGLVAAICTTIASLPQVIKTIKTKQVKDLSLSMYLILTIGVFLWLVYGILIQNFPLILANGITLIFVVTVLFLIIKYR